MTKYEAYGANTSRLHPVLNVPNDLIVAIELGENQRRHNRELTRDDNRIVFHNNLVHAISSSQPIARRHRVWPSMKHGMIAKSKTLGDRSQDYWSVTLVDGASMRHNHP